MANGSERSRNRGHVFGQRGERLSDAHHDWEERDGASDVGVEHTEEGIPESAPLAIPASIRNIAL